MSDKMDRFHFEVAKKSGMTTILARHLQRGVLNACGPLGSLLGQREDAAFGILMYHRVCYPIAGLAAPPYNVKPETLKRQLSGLLAKGYEPWSLRNALQACHENQPIPRKAFVVTFDDGYANNFSLARPILEELEIPATIFIATAYLDSKQPFPFDRWPGVGTAGQEETWQPLSTGQCESLLKGGLIDLGVHTHTHADFRGRPADFKEDLETSTEVMKSSFGIQDCTFAFPQGRKAPGFAGADLIEAARSTTVTCALTTENELVKCGSDPFGDWGRFTIEEADAPGTIAARLDGWYGLIRQIRRGMLR